MDRKLSLNAPSSNGKPLKTLFILSGSDSAKKTQTCESLKTSLPHSVYLNGKWCWNADPMIDNNETRYMVLQNICFLLNQFLVCPAYDNIIFSWVFDQKHTIESILGSLDKQDCTIHLIHLDQQPQGSSTHSSPVFESPSGTALSLPASQKQAVQRLSGPKTDLIPDVVEITTIDANTLEVNQIVGQILAAVQYEAKTK